MNVSTNDKPGMPPYLPLPAHRATHIIQDGGLVLLPSANLWQVLGRGLSPLCAQRLFRLCPPTASNRPEWLFADLDQLREWVPRLHPKIDNLLYHHRRPLTVLLPYSGRFPENSSDAQGRIAVRLAQDSFVYRLLEEVDEPLLACLAMPSGSSHLPTHFGCLRSDLIRQVDYTVTRRQRDILGRAPATCIGLNAKDEIEFH